MTENHRLAVESYRKGELNQAERFIGAALGQGESSEVWNDWAMVQLALGRQFEAEKGFRKALELNRDHRKAAANLGILLFSSAKFSESLPYLCKAYENSVTAEREMLSAMIAKCGALGIGASAGTTGRPSAQPSPSQQCAPAVSKCEQELRRAYQEFDSVMSDLRDSVEQLVTGFPENQEAQFFLADLTLAAGFADEASLKYGRIAAEAGPNQVRRAQQGIQQCDADRDYFPPAFARHLADIYSTGLNAQVHHNYANREIQRGRAIARQIRQHIPLAGRRFLDVGCGYGGTLICFAEQGCDVVGVEIDPRRAAIGKERIANLGLNVDYRLDDICSSGAVERLGTFDIIVVQDVLEHVMDPALAIRALTTMLRKDGLIYVVVGNKYSPNQLLADHHFSQPGMTVLARSQALEYFQSVTGSPRERYDVGYWRTEFYYRRMFKRCGVELEHVGSFGTVDHVLWYATSMLDVCARAEQPIHPKLRPELQARIQRRMLTVARYFCGINEIIDKCEDPQLKAKLCDRLIKRICLPTWSFVGVKKS